MRHRYRNNPTWSQDRMKIPHSLERICHMFKHLAEQRQVLRVRHSIGEGAVEELFLWTESVDLTEYSSRVLVWL